MKTTVADELRDCCRIRDITIVPEVDQHGENMLKITITHSGQIVVPNVIKAPGKVRAILERKNIDAWPLLSWRRI